MFGDHWREKYNNYNFGTQVSCFIISVPRIPVIYYKYPLIILNHMNNNGETKLVLQISYLIPHKRFKFLQVSDNSAPCG